MAVKIIRISPPKVSEPPQEQDGSKEILGAGAAQPETFPSQAKPTQAKPSQAKPTPKPPTITKNGYIRGRPRGVIKRTPNPLKTLNSVMAHRGNMPAKDKKLAKQTASYPDFIKRLTIEQKAILDSNMLANKTEGAILSLLLEWGVDGGQSESTLRKAIQRYRYKFIEPQQAQIAAKTLGQQTPPHIKRLAVAAEAMEKILKPVAAIEEVILHQMQRVNKLKDTEARMPTLLDSQTKNLSLLSDMLFKLSSLHLEIGLLRKVPQKHDVTMTAEQQAFVSSLKVDDYVNKAKLNVISMLTERGILSSKGTKLAPIPSALDTQMAGDADDIEDVDPLDPLDTIDGVDDPDSGLDSDSDITDYVEDEGFTEGGDDFMQPPDTPPANTPPQNPPSNT